MNSRNYLKKYLPLLIFLVFGISNSILGQDNPLLKEIIFNKFRKYNLEEYKSYHQTIEYNDRGDTLSKVEKYYEYPNSLINWYSTFFEYDTQNRISKTTLRRYNWTVDLWITIYWIDYSYDTNHCLIQKVTTANAGNFSQTLTYEVDSDCNIFESTDDRSYYDFFTYNYPDENGSEVIKGFKELSTGTYEVYQSKFLYNEHKDLTRREVIYRDTIQGDTTLFSLRKYDYDYFFSPFTALITFKNRKYFSNLGTSDTLDEQTLRRVATYYKYQCDNIISSLVEDHPFVHYEKLFIYEGKNECFDFDQKFEVSLSPNPTSDLVQIKSRMIHSGDFLLRVFTLDGKSVFEKQCQLRGAQTEIDLSFLNNGIYIISLNNGKKITSEKLVIAKR